MLFVILYSDIASAALDQFSIEKDIAASIKKEFGLYICYCMIYFDVGYRQKVSPHMALHCRP